MGIHHRRLEIEIVDSIYTIELYDILTSRGITFHFYADHSQIMIEVTDPAQANRGFNGIYQLIREWLTGRKLKKNADRTDCIIFKSGTRSGHPLQDLNHILLDNHDKIMISDNVQNFGFIFYQNLTLNRQINKVRGKAIGNLINISRISRCIDSKSSK